MIKWLTITLIVVVGFMTILLGLGYLLNENEKSTTVLKAQLEQQALAEKERQQRIKQRSMLSDYNQLKTSNSAKSVSNHDLDNKVIADFKKVVIENLTCVSSQQCQVATVHFKNVACAVAINNIGASLLAKLSTKNSVLTSCPEMSTQAKLICRNNLCTLNAD